MDKIAWSEEQEQKAKAALVDMQRVMEQKLEEAERRVRSAEAAAALAREEASKEVAEMRRELERIREEKDQMSRLAAMAETSLATAKAQVESFAEKASQADHLHNQLAEVRGRNQDIEHELVRMKEDLELAKQHRDAMKVAHNNEIVQRLQAAAERAQLDKERAVLEAQREGMELLNQLREALAKCREEKAALEVQIIQGKYQPKE
ncbi:hypothetical protein [Heliophilum fasciatum]|uniref:hypothetical protein n=1 Tax=Heliophilum fasciatum TaxID=35700 RepID=UPI001053F20D|nr:hypothetical protein [Heliophilum fasciatum]MCW2278895.1 chromosome segregation ATPase [Heliophilum fasciatum]